MKTTTSISKNQGLAPAALPDVPPEYNASRNQFPVPDDGQCFEAWDRYLMPDHIREHSRMVGRLATIIAQEAVKKDEMRKRIDVQEVRASALLHDLGKMYCIHHKGNHATLGAAWAMAATGNPALAGGVQHHVWWPFEVDPTRWFLPLAVLYADKRVKHDTVVSLGSRYADLFERYGRTPEITDRIKLSMDQARAVEHTLSELTGAKLNACTFSGRGLVA